MTVDRESEVWMALRKQMSDAWHSGSDPTVAHGWDRVIAAFVAQPEPARRLLDEVALTREQERTIAVEALQALKRELEPKSTGGRTVPRRRLVQHRGGDD